MPAMSETESEINAIEAAYVLGVTPARVYKIKIKTIDALIKEIKKRQLDNLPLYRSMWKRLGHVRAMLVNGKQATTYAEQVESYAWTIGWCGDGDVKEWAEARTRELETLLNMISSVG